MPCACEEVDSNVEHILNVNILHILEKEEETGESENEVDLELTDSLIEEFDIDEEEHENLEDEEKSFSVDTNDDDSRNEDDVLKEDDLSVEEALQEEDDFFIVTDEENTVEDKNLSETNTIEEINHDQSFVEEITDDEKLIAPKKDGLLKRLTKCFFSRQSA